MPFQGDQPKIDYSDLMLDLFYHLFVWVRAAMGNHLQLIIMVHQAFPNSLWNFSDFELQK